METSTPQGSASLAGAEYGLFKDNVLVKSYFTNANGQFTTDYYTCGTGYTIKEITPSEGYLLDETVYSIDTSSNLFTIERNSIYLNVTEQIIKGNMSIIKHADNGDTQIETPESGATFEVFLKSSGSYNNSKDSEKDMLVTDEYGYAESKILPYGIYTVRQTIGIDGSELMKDFDVYIAENGKTYRYIINNAPFESYVRVVKTDAETGNVIPYAGAGFQIYDPTGNLITMAYTYPTPTTLDTFYTDENGTLVTPEKLTHGTEYSLVEVQAPYGYVLDSNPIYFDVTNADIANDTTITVIEVVKSNKPQKGTISITKTGEIFDSVINSNEIYQPVYAVTNLKGATFEIIASEDIITPDGTVRANVGSIVDVITTDETGIATSELLYLGKYSIKEITAPENMVLNQEFYDVELSYEGQEIEITTTDFSMENDRQKVALSLNKILETNDILGNNGEILEVSFGLYANEILTANDGTIIPQDGLIEVQYCDENGFISFTTDLPFGKYYVKELSTNKAYYLNGEKFEFTAEYQGQDLNVVEIQINNGTPIENKLIKSDITGFKIDEMEVPLPDATIGLFDGEEVEFTEETALMTTISNEDGSFSFKNVPFGNYIVKEIAPPNGYVLSEEIFPVTISEESEVLEILIINKLISGNVSGLKVDENDKVLAGATIGIFESNEIELTEENALGVAITNESGEFSFENLNFGEYFVREIKSPLGYTLSEEIFPVTIAENEEVIEVKIVNTSIRKDITGIKVDEENKGLAGANIGLFVINEKVFTQETALMTTVSGVDGSFAFNSIAFGTYIVREISAPTGYILSDEIFVVEVTADANPVLAITIVNELAEKDITGYKVDGDNEPLEGALIGLFAEDEIEFIENAIQTVTSKSDGSFVFEGVVYGDYIVREIEAPKGYVLSEETFEITVSDEEVEEIEIINIIAKGDVALTKFDVDFPENKLTGAIFEVFEDANENEEFDEDDKIIGEMIEFETGEYIFEDLVLGGYFVKEKVAPVGFVLDENAYYFEISENGQIVEVENDAGKGFLNSAQKGNIKIVKTSADDVIEGFTFLLEGTDFSGKVYEQEFTTDENGEIFIENIRIGEYTLTEIESELTVKYILPESQSFVVTANETIVLEFFNDLKDRPVTPETGDSSNNPLWLILGGISVLGLAAVVVVWRRVKGK